MGSECTLHICRHDARRKQKWKQFSARPTLFPFDYVWLRALRTIGAPSETRNVIFNGIVCALQSTIHYVHIYTFRTRMKITYNFTRNFVHWTYSVGVLQIAIYRANICRLLFNSISCSINWFKINLHFSHASQISGPVGSISDAEKRKNRWFAFSIRRNYNWNGPFSRQLINERAKRWKMHQLSKMG